MKLAVILAAILVVSCGATRTPYAEVTTEWDDVGAAPACDPEDPTQNCLEARAGTVRIDDEVRLAIESATWDEATSTLSARLKAGASLDPRIKVGTILYRARKDRRPLLHRVDALSVDGRTVTAQLSRVTVKDAFKKGRLRARLYLSETGSTGQPLTARPGVQQQPLELALGPSDCSGTVLDGSLVGQVIPGRRRPPAT
jgi:hypothetical protein